MLTARIYDKKDYEILVKWFQQYDWKPYPQSSISPWSYFVESDGVPIAYSSVYLTHGTDMALLGFTIADKEADKLIRGKAVDMAIKKCLQIAKDSGYNFVYYFTDSEIMVKKLQKLGATLTDNGTAYILAMSLKKDNIEHLD